MKKIVLLGIVLQFISTALFAQRKQHLNKGDLFARFTVTDLINPLDNAITIGTAYMVHKRWSVAADIGYIFNSTSNEWKHNANTKGFMSKIALRWHYTKSKRSFVELIGFYKSYSYNATGWLGMDCTGGVPAYQKWTDYKTRKIIPGAVLKWGYTGQLSKNGKFWYEASAGFTLKYATEKLVNQPANTCIINTISNTSSLGATDTPLEGNPGIQIGFKLLYRIKQQ